MSKKGEPADCDAPPGKCPLGGDHYDDFESAEAGVESHLAGKYSATEGLRKSGVNGTSNHTRHIDSVECYVCGTVFEHDMNYEDAYCPECGEMIEV